MAQIRTGGFPEKYISGYITRNDNGSLSLFRYLDEKRTRKETFGPFAYGSAEYDNLLYDAYITDLPIGQSAFMVANTGIVTAMGDKSITVTYHYIISSDGSAFIDNNETKSFNSEAPEYLCFADIAKGLSPGQTRSIRTPDDAAIRNCFSSQQLAPFVAWNYIKLP